MTTELTCVMIGLGYIGLPTAVTMARHDMRVVGVDINEAIVRAVNSGACPIAEAGLPEALATVVARSQAVLHNPGQQCDTSS